MGLALNVAVLLREWFLAAGAKGPVGTLGVMDVGFGDKTFLKVIGERTLWMRAERPMDVHHYFETCGLTELLSIDVSNYEGADVEFDLNSEQLPSDLQDRFGVVLNGGTLEHVFHVPNALSNITQMLRPGGLAVHILPMNNCVDHGFYQFSPTLLLDYYAAAKFDLLNSVSLHFGSQRPSAERWQVKPALPGSYGEGLLGMLDSRIAFHMFVARKKHDSLDRATPVQSLYSRKFAGTAPALDGIEWFSPFEMEDGRRLPSPTSLEFSLSSLTASGGLMWSCTLPASFPHGDDSASPISSSLALFEDGKLIGPAHSSHETIKTVGKGAYSHWGNALYFSSSDGSDPTSNGRLYTCKC
jgi:SAM-dependent methyltransferase